MRGFVVRRLAGMALVLLAVSLTAFLVFNVIPGGDPTVRIAGRSASEQTRAQVREDFGFDRSYPVQYVRLIGQVLDGTLTSYPDRVNVRAEIVRGIPATASLVIGAAVIWVLFGIGFGVLSARYAGRWPDRVIGALAMVAISLPVFWVGAMLLYYLTYRVELFPPGGYVGLSEDPGGWLTHLLLPWFTLSLLFIGVYARVLRASMLDAEHEDYVRTARAKGLSERRVMTRHVLRNALVPLVTLFGLDFGAAIGGGAILTEAVFDLHGVGQYAAGAVDSLDLPPVIGTTLYAAFFIVLMSALVDIVYGWLDPRVRVDG
ncbi:MAG: ABC transporter permease [Solirubrobacteraceae bacterium]